MVRRYCTNYAVTTRIQRRLSITTHGCLYRLYDAWIHCTEDLLRDTTDLLLLYAMRVVTTQVDAT